MNTQKAYEYLLENSGLEYVIDTYRTPNFIEVVGSIGGDVLTFRVYEDKDNGFYITER